MSVIGRGLTSCDVRYVVAIERKAEVTRTLPEDRPRAKGDSARRPPKSSPLASATVVAQLRRGISAPREF